MPPSNPISSWMTSSTCGEEEEEADLSGCRQVWGSVGKAASVLRLLYTLDGKARLQSGMSDWRMMESPMPLSSVRPEEQVL